MDPNVFLHAFLTPRRTLAKQEQKVKDEAKGIVGKIERDEEVAMTTAHLSEVVNIVETGLGLQESLGFLACVLSKENVKAYPVSIRHYEAAMPLAKDSGTSANDALACLSMRAHKLKEIYSFDRHFGRLEGIVRLPRT